MRDFSFIINFVDGTHSTARLKSANYRTAFASATALLPAWSNRVVSSISLIKTS